MAVERILEILMMLIKTALVFGLVLTHVAYTTYA